MEKTSVLCFGELLYRIQSKEELFAKNQSIAELYPGGSEANVAVALAQLGVTSYYYSIGPDNPLVHNIIQVLMDNGVDCSKFRFAGDRLGGYFLMSANGLTNGEVVYDRKYSSFYQLNHNDIDWDTLFSGINWFHWTALSPALSIEHILLCKIALSEARKRNITISVDLNYRSKLWQYGKAPLDVMPDLVKECDVIMGNIWASNVMLGTKLDESWSGDRKNIDYPNISKEVAEEVFVRYPRCRHLAFTYRFMDSPMHNLLYATYHTPNNDYLSEVYETNNLIDRIGSGDAFMAGIIAGIVNKDNAQNLINLATEVGYKKLFVKGDFIKL